MRGGTYAMYKCSDCGWPGYGSVKDFAIDELTRYYCKRHYWAKVRELEKAVTPFVGTPGVTKPIIAKPEQPSLFNA